MPGLIFHIDGFEFRETFAAPEEALDALAAFQEGGEQPPWDHVSDLLADGLIDVHIGLTPRAGERSAPEPAGSTQQHRASVRSVPGRAGRCETEVAVGQPLRSTRQAEQERGTMAPRRRQDRRRVRKS